MRLQVVEIEAFTLADGLLWADGEGAELCQSLSALSVKDEEMAVPDEGA